MSRKRFTLCDGCGRLRDSWLGRAENCDLCPQGTGATILPAYPSSLVLCHEDDRPGPGARFFCGPMFFGRAHREATGTTNITVNMTINKARRGPARQG